MKLGFSVPEAAFFSDGLDSIHPEDQVEVRRIKDHRKSLFRVFVI